MLAKALFRIRRGSAVALAVAAGAGRPGVRSVPRRAPGESRVQGAWG